jgi:hypothetical protein
MEIEQENKIEASKTPSQASLEEKNAQKPPMLGSPFSPNPAPLSETNPNLPTTQNHLDPEFMIKKVGPQKSKVHGYKLYFNAERNKFEEVVKLIKMGVFVDYKAGAPLAKACRFGNSKIYQYLIEVGADCNINHGVALYNAVLGKNIKTIFFLLKSGAKTDLFTPKMKTEML